MAGVQRSGIDRCVRALFTETEMNFEEWFEQYAPTAPESLDDCAKSAWKAGVMAERESCAKALEDAGRYGKSITSCGKTRMPAVNVLHQMAKQIRARSNALANAPASAGD